MLFPKFVEKYDPYPEGRVRQSSGDILVLWLCELALILDLIDHISR